jgi:hypothetical protein
MGGLQRGLRDTSQVLVDGVQIDRVLQPVATVGWELQGRYRAAGLRGRLAWDCTAG